MRAEGSSIVEGVYESYYDRVPSPNLAMMASPPTSARVMLPGGEDHESPLQHYIHRCPFKHCPHQSQTPTTTAQRHLQPQHSLQFLNIVVDYPEKIINQQDQHVPSPTANHFKRTLSDNEIICPVGSTPPERLSHDSSLQYIERGQTSRSCPDSPILCSNAHSAAFKSSSHDYVSLIYRQKALKFIMGQLCGRTLSTSCGLQHTRLLRSVQRLEYSVFTSAQDKDQYIELLALKLAAISEEMKIQVAQIKKHQTVNSTNADASAGGRDVLQPEGASTSINLLDKNFQKFHHSSESSLQQRTTY